MTTNEEAIDMQFNMRSHPDWQDPPTSSPEKLSPSIAFSATTFKQRDQWSRKAARDRRVKLSHRGVLCSLALCARTDKDGRLVIDPTYDELAKASGCSRLTAIRAVAVAEEIGIIRKARHSDGRVSNAFELLLPNTALNGVKNAAEKTQEFQRPTVSNFAAAETANGITADTVLRVERKQEVEKTLSPTNTFYVERSEISLDIVKDTAPVLPREEKPVQDAAPKPASTAPATKQYLFQQSKPIARPRALRK